MKERVRLRRVEVVDFRKTEATNFQEFTRSNRALVASFAAGDAVAFLASNREQVVFVHGITEVDNRQIIASRRLRIINGSFSGHMLQHYASEVGLELINFPSLEERMEAERLRKRKRERDARLRRQAEERRLINTQSRVEREARTHAA